MEHRCRRNGGSYSSPRWDVKICLMIFMQVLKHTLCLINHRKVVFFFLLQKKSSHSSSVFFTPGLSGRAVARHVLLQLDPVALRWKQCSWCPQSRLLTNLWALHAGGTSLDVCSTCCRNHGWQIRGDQTNHFLFSLHRGNKCLCFPPDSSSHLQGQQDKCTSCT